MCKIKLSRNTKELLTWIVFFTLGGAFSLFFYNQSTVRIEYNHLFLFIGWTIVVSSFLLREEKIKTNAKQMISLSIGLLFVAILLNFLGLFYPSNFLGTNIENNMELFIFLLYLILILLSFAINGMILRHLYKILIHYKTSH